MRHFVGYHLYEVGIWCLRVAYKILRGGSNPWWSDIDMYEVTTDLLEEITGIRTIQCKRID